MVNYNRSKEAAERVTAEINSASPGAALVCKADVSNHQEVEGLVAETLQAWGRIDILVNNAGAFPMGTSFPTGSRPEGSWIVEMEKVNVAIPGPIPHPRLEWLFRAGETEMGLLHRDQTPEEFARFVVNLSKLENVSGQIFVVENRIVL